MKSINKFLCPSRMGFLCVFMLLSSHSALAVLDIEITQGIEGALPIAVIPFVSTGQNDSPPETLNSVVAGDLQRSGRFNPVDEDVFPQQIQSGAEIDYPLWRNQGIENIVTGSMEQKDASGYIITFQLLDTIRGRQLMEYRVPVTQRNLRKFAHKISDLVYEKLTGERGAFSSRVAYISTHTNTGGKKRYILQVADSDGHNAQEVYASKDPLMSPSWSPDNRKIAYVSFENGHSEVVVQNLGTGERNTVSARPGINSAPAWSSDGSQLALVSSVKGSPDIYVQDVKSGKQTRLTHGSGINTEPAWMPDGGSLVFTSDRSGQPQLYQIAVTGGRAKRITFEGSYNAAADISPKGHNIALVHNDGEGFRIAVMDMTNGNLRVLTDGQLDESPSFAPNGSMIIYATEYSGRGVLSAVSQDGQVHQRLSLQASDVREPVWSKFTE